MEEGILACDFVHCEVSFNYNYNNKFILEKQINKWKQSNIVPITKSVKLFDVLYALNKHKQKINRRWQIQELPNTVF